MPHIIISVTTDLHIASFKYACDVKTFQRHNMGGS